MILFDWFYLQSAKVCSMKKIFFSFVIFTTPLISQAAGFALIEQNASGMGNAYAGGSAIAEDAMHQLLACLECRSSQRG